MNTKRVVLFSPAFNVADVLPEFLSLCGDLRAVLYRHRCSLKIIVIDDASTDGTAAILSKPHHPFLSVMHNEVNLGNAANIIKGYTEALRTANDHTLIGCLDADGEHNPLAFRKHIDTIDRGACDGVVGSIIYPSHKLGWADLHMMRFLGSVQATFMGVTDPFYIQSPGFQLHRPTYLRAAVMNLLPRYRVFFEEHIGPFPRWGMHSVIDSLISLSGGRLQSAYLECFGTPPNRDAAKLEAQARAALDHQKGLREFAQLLPIGK